ncbi:hypothetical protein FRC01_004601 [Tulasnella sp. 417]|nr:hypothetical protein FRC01_004601 [Tulasnella sp. 417]
MRSSEMVIDAVKAYNSLTSLDIQANPQELAQVVELASQMGHLTHATFLGVGTTDTTLPDDSFKLIQTLRIEGHGVEGIRRIASSVMSPDLRQLDITWAPDSTPVSEADYLPPLDRFQKLRILLLDAPASFLLHSCIAPALNCHDLEVVYIRGKNSDFTQETLRTMAQSWPNLRDLQLALAGPSRTGVLSLGMLRCFAEFCPRLKTLAARVLLDLAGDSLNEMRQEAPGVGSALQQIDIGRSVIVLPFAYETEKQALKDVAASLLASWPNLTTVRCDRGGEYRDDWDRLQRALDSLREELSAPASTNFA